MPNVIKVSRETIRSYSVDLGTELQATEYYIVYFDGPATPVLAELAAGVPAYTQPHPDDSRRLLKQKRPQCIDNSNRQHWEVQCDYSSLVNSQPNPLLRPPVIAWDYSNADEAYAVDCATDYGKTAAQAVTTTAGEPLEASRESGTWSATWTKNVSASFTIAPEIGNMQCVNSDNFLFDGSMISQYTAKISGGSLSGVQIENGYSYRTVSYKLKFLNRQWIDYLANVGLEEMNSGKRVPIMSGLPGQPPTKISLPWPIDEDGVAYAKPTTTPDLLTFYPYHTMAFTPLFTSPAYGVFGGGTLITSGGQ